MVSLLGRDPTEVVLGLPPLPRLALLSRKLFRNLDARPELEPLLPSEFRLAALPDFPPLLLPTEPLLSPESALPLNLEMIFLRCLKTKQNVYHEAILSRPSFFPDGDCLTAASTTVPVSEEAVLVLTISFSKREIIRVCSVLLCHYQLPSPPRPH